MKRISIGKKSCFREGKTIRWIKIYKFKITLCEKRFDLFTSLST